jgi:hypothetical protein
MDRLQIPRSTATSTAHLLIHAQPGQSARSGGGRSAHFDESVWTDGEWDSGPTPLSLKVEDLGGHRVFDAHDPGPFVDVPLPAGMYCVTTRYGEVERQYTLVLKPAQSVDLHLVLQNG